MFYIFLQNLMIWLNNIQVRKTNQTFNINIILLSNTLLGVIDLKLRHVKLKIFKNNY